MAEPPPERNPSFDPATVRAIVFDLDGTLVDSYGPIAASLNHARASFGLGPLRPAIVRTHVGRGLECLIAELVGEAHVEAGVRLFRERYEQVFRDGTFALPGVRATLRELASRGYRMAVASNKPARFSRPILRRLALGGRLDPVLGPDVVGPPKPDPTMIRVCLQRMGVGPREAVYVGDMGLDAESGANAGVSVLLVAGGSADATELRRTGWPVLGTIRQLREWLPARS